MELDDKIFKSFERGNDMRLTEKFKRGLKDLRRQLTEKLQYYKEQENEFCEKLGRQSMEVAITYQEFTDKMNQEEYESFLDAKAEDICLQNRDESRALKRKMLYISRIISDLNDVINNFSLDRADRFIPLQILMELLYYACSANIISLEEAGRILGMVIRAGSRNLGKDSNRYSEVAIIVLEDYFNEDGTFKYNDRIDRFKVAIEYLERCPDTLRMLLSKFLHINYDRVDLSTGLTELLAANNALLREKVGETSTLLIKQYMNDFEEKSSQIFGNTGEQDSLWQVVSMCFDHEKAIKPIDLSCYLYTVVACTMTSEVDPKAAVECLGMLVHIDQSANSRIYDERYPKEVKRLVEYFNEDGTFKENSRVLDFRTMIGDLMRINFRKPPALQLPKSAEDLLERMVGLLEKSNDEYRRSHVQRKKEALAQKARERLIEYYDYIDGRVVAVPFDLDDFLDILGKCDFSEDENETIMRHMNNRVKIRGYKIGYILDEEELQLYLDATDLLTELSKDSSDRLEIEAAISNLSSLVSLYSSELDTSEKAYLEEEKHEILDCLERIVKKYALSGESSVGRGDTHKSLVIEPLK